MPAVVEAARAEATLGEIMGVLKEVFGWGFVY
jgi:methylmalonyl-CoA mutase N-terminal domain/subunit